MTPKLEEGVLDVGRGLWNATKDVLNDMRDWAREKIIAFKGGFHGRTYLAMGLTGKEKPYKEGFGPFPKFITHVAYPYHYRDISDEKVLKQIENTLLKKIEKILFFWRSKG